MTSVAEAAVAGLAIARVKGQRPEAVEHFDLNLCGVVGDRHAGPGLRQVSLMSDVVVTRMAGPGAHVIPGAGHENIAVAGLEGMPLRVLDCLAVGAAELEVTAVGSKVNPKGKDACTHDDHCTMGEYGVFARVRRPGRVRLGDVILHHRRILRAQVITLSDRAHSGKYEDRSGPIVDRALLDFGAQSEWQVEVTRQLLADDAGALLNAILSAHVGGAHLIMTTGGTGAGPRDVTPEVIAQVADRTLPGVMERVRQQSAGHVPFAVTSRSVAAVKGETLMLALPGSPRAAEEYMAALRPLLEHLLLLIRGVEAH